MTLATSTAPVVGGRVGTDAAQNMLGVGNNAADAGTRGFTGNIAEVSLKSIPTAIHLEAIRKESGQTITGCF